RGTSILSDFAAELMVCGLFHRQSGGPATGGPLPPLCHSDEAARKCAAFLPRLRICPRLFVPSQQAIQPRAAIHAIDSELAVLPPDRRRIFAADRAHGRALNAPPNYPDRAGWIAVTVRPTGRTCFHSSMPCLAR